MGDPGYRTSDRRVIPWLLLGLVVLFGGMYVAACLYTSARLPRQTSVDGVDVGGMLPAGARRALTDDLGGRAAEPLVVSANGRRAALSPRAAGLRVDVAATVARLRPVRSWDPARLWGWLADRHERTAVVTLDRAALTRTVARLARRVDEPAVEGAVTFRHGRADARYPRAGTVVARAAAASVVRRSFLHVGSRDVVALPTRPDRSPISKDAVSRAMADVANPAVSAPLTLRLGHRSVRVDPEDYVAALSLEPVGSELRLRVDPRALLRRLHPALHRLTHTRHGRVSFDRRRLPSQLARAVTRTGPGRTVTLTSRAQGVGSARWSAR